MTKVLVLVDRDAREGTVRRSTHALLTLARRLGEPVAVVGGAPPDDEAIRALGRYGATEVWCLAGAAGLPGSPAGSPLANPATGPDGSPGSPDSPPGSARASSAARPTGALVGDAGAGAWPAAETDLLVALAHRLNPAAILIASGHRGQETAARLAVRLDSGIITDAIDILPGPDGEPLAIQHCLAGSYLVESSVIRGFPIITVRPEAAVPEPHPAEPVLYTIAVEPSEARVPRISAIPKPRLTPPALDHADIVVAGGRGVGSRAAFAVLTDVAEALGAAVAGSHTAAELGWIPPEARVGLTGKTVHPRLYLACGVSGSVRHRAGMQGAKTVVVIGDDPAAPIFKLADLGVVGDARTILPALLAEIRERKQLGAGAPSGLAADPGSDPNHDPSPDPIP